MPLEYGAAGGSVSSRRPIVAADVSAPFGDLAPLPRELSDFLSKRTVRFACPGCGLEQDVGVWSQSVDRLSNGGVSRRRALRGKPASCAAPLDPCALRF